MPSAEYQREWREKNRKHSQRYMRRYLKRYRLAHRADLNLAERTRYRDKAPEREPALWFRFEKRRGRAVYAGEGLSIVGTNDLFHPVYIFEYKGRREFERW